MCVAISSFKLIRCKSSGRLCEIAFRSRKISYPNKANLLLPYMPIRVIILIEWLEFFWQVKLGDILKFAQIPKRLCLHQSCQTNRVANAYCLSAVAVGWVMKRACPLFPGIPAAAYASRHAENHWPHSNTAKNDSSPTNKRHARLLTPAPLQYPRCTSVAIRTSTLLATQLIRSCRRTRGSISFSTSAVLRSTTWTDLTRLRELEQRLAMQASKVKVGGGPNCGYLPRS